MRIICWLRTVWYTLNNLGWYRWGVYTEGHRWKNADDEKTTTCETCGLIVKLGLPE